MNRKRILIVLIVILVGVLVSIWNWPRPEAQPTDTAHEARPQLPPPSTKQTDTQPQGIDIPEVPGRKLSDQDKSNIAKIVQAFSAPIDFWGKVIDQHGDPVIGAAAHYSAADKYFKDGTKYKGTSDAQGLFSISNIKGAGLFVNVAKQGYYGTEQSGRSFGYGTSSGEAPPTKENPAIFVLHKMGETEPLIKLETGGVLVPQDGTPHKLSLRRERGRFLSGSSNADLQIELWSGYKPPPPHGQRYDWRVRVSVPNGGLVERGGTFNFEAPKDGYTAAFEFAMPATTERWQSRLEKEFFLKLADGCYARIDLKVIAGGDIFVVLESYLNPKPGSRNLEFDPTMAIKPKP